MLSNQGEDIWTVPYSCKEKKINRASITNIKVTRFGEYHKQMIGVKEEIRDLCPPKDGRNVKKNQSGEEVGAEKSGGEKYTRLRCANH